MNDIWGLRPSFELIGSKRLTKPKVENPSSNFHKKKASFNPES